MAITQVRYHAPGWKVDGGVEFEALVWLPGEVNHEGHFTGEVRTQYMVGLDIGWEDTGEDEWGNPTGRWRSGYFEYFDEKGDLLSWLDEWRRHLGPEVDALIEKLR